VARLRSGDPAAFGDVYARFSDPTYRFLLRLSGRREVAMDLHQDTWLSAARHARGLAEETDLAAWLFTIARNKHRSWRRFVALDWLRFDRDAGDIGDIPEAAAEASRMDARDELESLEKALMKLPEGHREVLLLIGVEGLSSAQAADVLGIQPDALRQRLSRARAALAGELEGQEAEVMVQARRGAG
jgi:RNA polymerase sigma-70 factor (ECF subfamily)